jgi:hypothetical protein
MSDNKTLKLRKLILGVFLALCPSAAFANQNSPEMIIFGSLAMVALAGFGVYYAFKADEAALDPENSSFADQDTLPAKLQRLMDQGGTYSLAVVRQSGNVERIVENLTAPEVVKKVSQTMRKAKIETVSLSADGDALQLYRVMHNGRGRQEGKRIGGFNIVQTGWGSDDISIMMDDNHELDLGDNDDPALEFNFDADNEAKKAIIKSFFTIVSTMKHSLNDTEMPNIPEALIENFDPETGEGSATLDAADLVTLLVYSDLHLSGEAEMTSAVREQFSSSDTVWQQKIGQDESILTVTGVLGYGSTTPEEVKEEFSSFWDICELFVSFESKNPHRHALNEIHRERMEQSRPKILDADF